MYPVSQNARTTCADHLYFVCSGGNCGPERFFALLQAADVPNLAASLRAFRKTVAEGKKFATGMCFDCIDSAIPETTMLCFYCFEATLDLKSERSFPDPPKKLPIFELSAGILKECKETNLKYWLYFDPLKCFVLRKQKIVSGRAFSGFGEGCCYAFYSSLFPSCARLSPSSGLCAKSPWI